MITHGELENAVPRKSSQKLSEPVLVPPSSPLLSGASEDKLRRAALNRSPNPLEDAPNIPHGVLHAYLGYYGKVIMVQVVIVKLSEHQLPIKCLRLASTSHTANRMFCQARLKKEPLVTTAPAMTTCMWY